MKVFETKSFRDEYKRLPQPIQRVFNKKLEFILENLRHPSLRVKRMKGYPDIWEASITRNYRFTFQREGDIIILRNIGTHDLLKQP